MREKEMFDFDAKQMSEMTDTYIIPWGISIVMALVIYIVGKIVVGILVNILGKVMAKSNL